MSIAIISPHLDDGVFSLGGLIGREVAAGRAVEVVTCFTAGPPLGGEPVWKCHPLSRWTPSLPGDS